MFLKKMFFKRKLKKFIEEQYFKYKFEIFILNENEPITWEYPYYTKMLLDDIAKDIFNNGIKIDNWFINGNQIESMKLIEKIETNIYIEDDGYSNYMDLTIKDVNYFNEKYYNLLSLYNSK